MKDHKKTDTSDHEETRTPAEEQARTTPNPPRTTTGKWTAPKFGSAGSGGAELEPGPEKA